MAQTTEDYIDPRCKYDDSYDDIIHKKHCRCTTNPESEASEEGPCWGEIYRKVTPDAEVIIAGMKAVRREGEARVRELVEAAIARAEDSGETFVPISGDSKDMRYASLTLVDQLHWDIRGAYLKGTDGESIYLQRRGQPGPFAHSYKYPNPPLNPLLIQAEFSIPTRRSFPGGGKGD